MPARETTARRLGANEAPPAIVSMFLGDELSAILDAIDNGAAYDAKEKEQLKIGVHILPRFPRDTTDRNRTSPFAFTGNKFEFRMLGSTASVSDANVVINTAVAESLKQFADVLENADDFENALNTLIRQTIKEHKRIIFNGNGYDEAWVAEAEKRGLLNLRTTPDALPYLIAEKNIQLFTSHKVFSREEIVARYEIRLENYSKLIHIEALTMIDMAGKEILPAVSAYTKVLAETVLAKKALGEEIDCSYEETAAAKLSSLTGSAYQKLGLLRAAVEQAEEITDAKELAMFYKDAVLTAMEALRGDVDALESITSAAYWPYPSCGELLFGIR